MDVSSLVTFTVICAGLLIALVAISSKKLSKRYPEVDQLDTQNIISYLNIKRSLYIDELRGWDDVQHSEYNELILKISFIDECIRELESNPSAFNTQVLSKSSTYGC